MTINTSANKPDKFTKSDKKQEMYGNVLPVNEGPLMLKKLRYTGIEIIGDLPWSTHFCQFYKTKQDLLDILIPYFKAGLENNEKCIWVTSEFLNNEEAISALKKGIPGFSSYLLKQQIEIFPYTDWYLKEGKFELKRVPDMWIDKYNVALKKGYDGLRVSGNSFWISNKKDWNDFSAFESEINNVIHDYNMLVLCTYSLEKCDANETIDVISNHEFALIKREGQWELFESSIYKKNRGTIIRNEDTLRGILDATKESVWLFGSDGVILMGNNTAIKRIGKPAEEIIGKKFSEILPPELTKSRTIQLKKVLDSGQPLEFEDERNGINFQHSFYPVFDQKQNVSYVASFSRDITERKKNEEILYQTQQRIKFHFDNSPLAIVEWNSDFIVILWSKQAEQLFGWKTSETVGKHIDKLNIIFEDDIPIVNKTMELLMSGKKKTVTSSNRNYTKSGKVIECTWHNSVMLDDGGNIVSVLSLVEDITDQKRAADTLRESEERFKAIAETTPVGIGVTNVTDGTFLYLNTAYEKSFGFNKGELIGHKSPEIYWDSTDRDKILEKLKKYGFVADYEVRLKRKDGSMFWSMSSIRPITFSGKSALLGSFIEITERKQAEEALQKNTVRLEILSDTASRLLASENPQEIVKELCVRVMNYLDCHTFFNFIVDENAGKLHLNTYAGIPDKSARGIEWLNYGVAICGCVALDGQQIIAENIPETIDQRTDLIKSFGIKAYACHPLMSRGKVIGTLSFGTKSRISFNDEEIALMKSVADQVAIAMARVIAEKELYDTKSYLENLINYANAPIIVWDSQSKIELFNRAFEKLTGYASDEVLGKKLDFLFPNESLNDAREKISQSLKTRLETVEIPILCKNGEIKTFLWNSANINDFNSKKLISTIAQGHDITERKRVLNQLKESEEKLTLALENGNIGVWVWNILTNDLEWDERMEKIFGFKPGSFGNKYEAFEACLVEEDIPHTRNAIKKALEEEVPFETIYRIKTNSGNINYINAKALVTKNKDGKPVKMTGVCFDITEMKKGAELALFKLNEELLRSNKELEQFAYIASHDLQEPLRMVSSFTQLLDRRYKDKLDQDAREFIQYAVEGASRMQFMINDLLAYSRIHTKGRDFNQVDMNEVLSQVIRNLQILIKEENALITNDELPSVKADEGQMVQLLQNLIGNSLKFCINPPRIHISVMEDRDLYTFAIRDNGIGIEKQYFDKIFQIFQRLQPKEEYSGTGIGLAICKRIVERHKGRIWLESEFGKGTTFYFSISKNISYAKQ